MRSIAILIWLLAACGGAPAQPSAPPAPTPPAARPEPPPPALPAGVPDTPVGRQLAWVLHVISTGGSVDKALVEAHFDPSFLKHVPVDQTITVMRQLAAQLGRLSVGEVETPAAERLLAHVESAKGGKLRVSVSVHAASGKMNGLLFRPDLAPKPSSMAGAVDIAGKLAPKAQLLVASLDRGTCKPLHQLRSGEPLAIGSVFKLYVLLGLAERIAAGKARWEEEIAVRDEWKSLPTGVTQDAAAGTKLTLRTLAERMISVSDNTAADHLLYTIGRKRVEAAVRASGHANPSRLRPFLSTRELFLFKLALPPAEVDSYIALRSEARRRAFVDRLAGRQPDVASASDWTSPRRIDQIEWFASADDLCRLMGTLWSRAQKPSGALVLDILSVNPGLQIPATSWPYIGFKGGSEPGVLSLTWLLRRDDDKWFVLALSFNAPTGDPLDQDAIFSFAGDVLELLAREGR